MMNLDSSKLRRLNEEWEFHVLEAGGVLLLHLFLPKCTLFQIGSKIGI